MSHACTAESFLKDVAGHNMTVKMDNGIYRHLLFKAAKDSWNQWFEIITWPGVLTIHGDMGTWTFARIDDMFKFFRNSETLGVNQDYWSGKLCMGCGSEGIDLAKDWDLDTFRKDVMESLRQYFDGEDDPERLAEARQELESVLSYTDEYEHDQRRAVYEFTSGDFNFDPMDIPDGKIWSYHFTWVCFATVWAIQKYDAMHAQYNAAVPIGETVNG